jgi:hypothetical protein
MPKNVDDLPVARWPVGALVSRVYRRAEASGWRAVVTVDGVRVGRSEAEWLGWVARAQLADARRVLDAMALLGELATELPR